MRRSTTLLLGALLLLPACGGGEPESDEGSASAPASPAAAATTWGAEQTPDPGRRVIEVEMLTDDQGNNRFRPARIEAHQGDVVRWKLVSGVHNVHFVADSNRNAAGLPPASELFQLPGQTYDLKVTLPEGHYYFQCDPHALLGMVGDLEVEDEGDD